MVAAALVIIISSSICIFAFYLVKEYIDVTIKRTETDTIRKIELEVMARVDENYEVVKKVLEEIKNK